MAQNSQTEPPSCGLGNNVKAVQMIDKEIEGYEEKIRALKRRRNGLAFISQLPPEILSTIFKWVEIMQAQVRGSYAYGARMSWISVTHVCSHWRHVALECPGLWSRIEIQSVSGTSITSAEDFLTRSKRAPLTLTADIRPASQERIRSVLMHMDRMQELVLNSVGQLDQGLFTIMETYPAPLLERFDISFIQGGVNSPRLPDQLFAGNHPSLRELRLTNCSHSWNLPSLDTLVSLRISDDSGVGSDRFPSLFQLISILSNTPNLEQLELVGNIPSSPPGGQLHSLILPRLSKLSLKGNIAQCVELLDHITYPATSSVKFTSLGPVTHTLTDVLRIMRHTINPERHIGTRQPLQYLALASSIPIAGRYYIKGWGVPGSYSETPLGEPPIYLDMGGRVGSYNPWNEERHVEFWNILPLEDLHCLDVIRLGLQEPTWMSFCGRLDRLTILKVDETGGARSILRILSTDRPKVEQQGDNYPQNPLPLYFPALRGLSIFHWNFETPPGDDGEQTSELFKLLVGCLEKRSRLGARMETMNILDCRCISRSDVEELEHVVSHVTWDGIEVMTDSEDEDESEEDYVGSFWEDSDEGYSDYDLGF
jgi:hypothetical protein